MTVKYRIQIVAVTLVSAAVTACAPSEGASSGALGQWEPIAPPRLLAAATLHHARPAVTVTPRQDVRHETPTPTVSPSGDAPPRTSPPLELASSVAPPVAAAPPAGVTDAVEDPRPTAAEYAAGTMPYMEIIRPRNRVLFRNAATVGDHVYGRLPGGIELPKEGAHHEVLDHCKERDTNFGSPTLVHLIEDSAAAVAREFPGATLGVCNVSKEGGGRMRWSKSHASGRDADIAFYMTDASGTPTLAPELTRFGGHLRSLDEEATYRYDVPRNWALIRALLTHPTAQVQWIFISRPLRRALLKQGEALGEDLALMIRAEQVLRQPGDSTAHRDHFHVRIFCPAGSRIEGCRDKEPYWPWIGERDDASALRAAALAEGLHDKHREIRKRVFDRIEARRLTDASPALAEVALRDPSGELQTRAMDLLVEWHGRDAEVSYALEGFLRRPGEDVLNDDPSFSATPLASSLDFEGPTQPYVIRPTKPRRLGQVKRAYVLLGRLGAPESAAFLADAIGSKRVFEDFAGGLPEALLAARAARHVMSLELVPALVEALSNPRGDVRTAAALALTRITNHSFGRSWGGHRDPEQLAKGVAMWRQWWDANRSRSREELLLEGFAEHGTRIESWRADGTLSKLVSACKVHDHIGYNADRTLSWLTGRRSMLDTTNGLKYARWRDWINGV